MSHITVSLRSNLTDDVFGSTEVPVPEKLSTTFYTQLNATLTPGTAAPNSNNTFAITFPSTARGHSFFFTLISLFPPTYKDRENGLRKDLAEHLAALQPKFLRFPGGNNLEGLSIQTRWDWKKTIGPLTERPGRPGNWGYFNTDGLGYLEYLEWCEDMEVEPLLTVYAGYSLEISGLTPGNTVAPDELDFFINEAIEQIEYATGPVSSPWGALRAEHGHPEPFSLKFVEIGNEDWFSDSYPWRFPRFLDALSAVYPNITYISSQAIEPSPSNQNITIPPGAMWDLHHYETPQFFKDRFNFFDNFNEVYDYPGVQIFVGEYSVLSRDRHGGVDWVNGEGRFKYPTTIAAVGEAIFALAMERNPDVVTLSSYAPLLQNFNSYSWTPDFIAFSANPNDTVLSTSYYQQQMFSKYHGEETLTVTNTEGDFDPVWWHAAKEGEKVYVKLVNAGPVEAPITMEFDFDVQGVNGTVLRHDDEYGFNYMGNATAISPKMFDVEEGVEGKVVEWSVPGFAVVVLEVV
jgi:alpha-N-arabinofuranosidase